MMSELEDIKARAAERRKVYDQARDKQTRWGQAEADLDRTIAIAEEQTRLDATLFQEEKAEREKLTRERDEARAAVLELRRQFDMHRCPSDPCWMCSSLADTESYEQYR